MFSSEDLGGHSLSGRVRWYLKLLVALVLLLAMATACDEDPAIAVTPVPTVEPTATPAAADALNGLSFEISLDGQLLATETVSTRLVDGAVLIESTVTWVGSDGLVERRAALLSPILYPTMYSYDRRVGGVASTWVMQRDGGAVDVLANNRAWFGPVQQEDITPAPGLVMEGSPSVLGLALAVLQFTEGRTIDQYTGGFEVPVVDVTADLIWSKPLTLEVSGDQSSAVIGTMALEGSIGADRQQPFTLWMRPDTRLLFRAEFPDYRFGFWEQLRDPTLSRPGLLSIERVSVPREATSATIDDGSQLLTFQGARSELSGRLYRPEGIASAPVMLLCRGWNQPGVSLSVEHWVGRGWAMFVLEPGENSSNSWAVPDEGAAEDLRAAARLLSATEGLDSGTIVLVATGDAAVLAALALDLGDDPTAADPAPFSAAVLGAFATDGRLLPDLASQRVLALAEYYGWNEEQTAQYLEQSIYRWTTWLDEGQQSLSYLGRRISLDPLVAWSQAAPLDWLSRSAVPLLILHGTEDVWTPYDGAVRMADALQRVTAEPVTFRSLNGVGHELGAEQGLLWSSDVDAAVWSWLEGEGR